jgi:hypothetical protein
MSLGRTKANRCIGRCVLKFLMAVSRSTTGQIPPIQRSLGGGLVQSSVDRRFGLFAKAMMRCPPSKVGATLMIAQSTRRWWCRRVASCAHTKIDKVVDVSTSSRCGIPCASTPCAVSTASNKVFGAHATIASGRRSKMRRSVDSVPTDAVAEKGHAMAVMPMKSRASECLGQEGVGQAVKRPMRTTNTQ